MKQYASSHPYQNICHVIILQEFFSQIKSLTNKQHGYEKMGVRGLATYFGNRDLFFDEVIAFEILKRILSDPLYCKNTTGVAKRLQGHH